MPAPRYSDTVAHTGHRTRQSARAHTRTKSENVTAAFSDEVHGETEGHFVADADTYGVDKQWCALKGIPIEVPESDGSSEPPWRPPTTRMMNELATERRAPAARARRAPARRARPRTCPTPLPHPARRATPQRDPQGRLGHA